MSRRKGNVSGGGDEQDGDPFADFGLTDEAREFYAEEPKAAKPQVKGTPPAAKRSPPGKQAKSVAPHRIDAPPSAQFKWEPADFETRSNSFARSCTSCFHYVRGGKFAVDNVYELKASERGSLYRVITDCKKHEREFELHELEQMMEKSKTLDTRFDETPRIRHYCFAGSTTWNLLAHIPEIKNYDGMCRDYLPGPRPSVSCDTCAHLSKPDKERPGASARSVDISAYRPLMQDADLARMRNLIGSMRQEYQRRDEMAKMEEEEYDQKLSDDVMTMVYDNRSPRNGTLNKCNENSFRACAAENRTNHCPKFSTSGRLETIAGEARWRELTINNKEYRESAGRLIAAEQADCTKNSEEAKTNLAQRPSCFSCVHQRAPVNSDLFREIHFNSPEIMNLRDGYRREKRQREAEERLVCAQPSRALGSEFPPQRQTWCEKYSTRLQNGKVQEYAYCLRVLKNHGGNCPSYEKSREDLPTIVQLPPLPPPRVPATTTAQRPSLEPAKSAFRFPPALMEGNFADMARLIASHAPSTPSAPEPAPSAPSTQSLAAFAALGKLFDSPLKLDPDWATRILERRRKNANGELGIKAAGEQKCGRCKQTAGLWNLDGKLWCLSCADWAAPS